MAQLDIKNCDFYIKDGYAGSVGAALQVNHKLADPTTAPTAAATGGGATGGLLAAGDYLLSYTLVTAYGETLRSSDSATLTVGSTNIPRITFPALPTGAVSRKLYVSTVSGDRTTEKLYASSITTTTYDMAMAAPGITSPPSVSAASLDYAVAVATMIVDGASGSVVTGDRFTVAGDTTFHTVTAHSETLGNTTSITFTPALEAVVADDALVTFQPHRLVIRIGEGNLQFTEKRAINYTKDRGKLDTVKLGDEDPLEVKLDFTWVFLKADTGLTPQIEDVFKKRGEAASWVSSAADLCEPYAVDLEIVYTPPCAGTAVEVYTLSDFRYEDLSHDFKQGQVSVTGKCNIKEATIARMASYAG